MGEIREQSLMINALCKEIDQLNADVERLRAENESLQKKIEYLQTGKAELLETRNKQRDAVKKGNELANSILENCNSLRNRAWKAEGENARLRAALVEEMAKAIWYRIQSEEYDDYQGYMQYWPGDEGEYHKFAPSIARDIDEDRANHYRKMTRSALED